MTPEDIQFLKEMVLSGTYGNKFSGTSGKDSEPKFFLSTNDVACAFLVKLGTKFRSETPNQYPIRCAQVMDFSPKFPELKDSYLGNSIGYPTFSAKKSEILENDISFPAWKVHFYFFSVLLPSLPSLASLSLPCQILSLAYPIAKHFFCSEKPSLSSFSPSPFLFVSPSPLLHSPSLSLTPSCPPSPATSLPLPYPNH
jgi:hypothetical protein